MTEKRPTLNQVFLPTRVLNRFIQDEHQFTGLVGRGRFYNELLYTCTLCKLNITSKLIQSCTTLSNNTIIAKYTIYAIFFIIRSKSCSPQHQQANLLVDERLEKASNWTQI